MAARIALFIGSTIVIDVIWSNRKEILDGVKSGWNWVKAKVTGEEPVQVASSPEGYISESDSEDLDAILCPISRRVMRDPVITPYGHCFDRSFIEDWLSREQTCPITRGYLTKEQLTPCIAIRKMIQQYQSLRNST